MKDLLDLLINIAHGTWSYRWYAISSACLVFALGWFVIASIQNQYTSSAKIHVDTKTVLQPLLKGLAVQQDVNDQVTMMSRVLLSTPTLEKVIRETDLDLDINTEHQMEKLQEKLVSNIDIARGRGKAEQNHFEIGYTSSDPNESYNVVKALLNVFIEATVGYERHEAVSAQRFLEQQVKEYESKITEAEDRLVEFKKEHVGLMPGDGLGYYDRLQQVISERERISLALGLANRRRSELKRQIQGEEPVFGFANQAFQNPTNSPDDAKIAEYERQIDVLLIRFTELHPEVVALRESIAEIQAKKMAEQKLLAESGVDVNLALANDPLLANPVYQTMKVALSNADVEVASLREQYAQQTRIIDKLKSNVDKVPEIEAELKHLNRDYELNKSKYHSLRERFESAKLSEEVGKSPDTVSFNIIQPPSVSISPIWPNRKLMHAALIVISLGIGAGIAFLFYQLRPVFLSPKYLQSVTSIPVWGAVSNKRDATEQRAATIKMSLFYAACSVMAVCFYTSILYQDAGVALIGGIRKIIGGV